MIIKKSSEKVNFRETNTKRLNIDLHVCSSGQQKSIRRGNVNDSMIYCREFIELGLYKYLWKRIFIYLVEDIGLGNLYLGEIILKLYKKFEEMNKDDSFEANYLYQAIYVLAISEKSRENDCMISLVKKFNIGTNEDKSFINRFCTDEYFKSSSKKKKIEINNLLDSEFKDYINNDLYSIYKECFNILWDLNGGDGIYLYVVNFYLIKKYGIGYEYYKNGINKWLESNKSKLHSGEYSFIGLDEFKIEDYVYDKHTIKGKYYYKRGFKHFFEEGGYLENEVDIKGNIYKKVILKLIDDGVISD